jgi:SAM-dependent methyltransferase
VHASFFDVDLPKCDAVTSLGECIGYLADPSGSLKTITSLFAQVYEALRPGGVFILDLAEPGRGKGPPVWVDDDDWGIMYRPDEDDKKRILTRYMTTFVRSGKTFRRKRETHRVRLYTRSEVLGALRSAGFRARTMPTYGYEPWPKGLVAYVARKPR